MTKSSWADVIRAIERSTIPPVFDNEAVSILTGNPTKDFIISQDLPHNMSFRGFFAINSDDTIMDFKIRVLHKIRHSSKARRWWRRH